MLYILNKLWALKDFQNFYNSFALDQWFSKCGTRFLKKKKMQQLNIFYL